MSNKYVISNTHIRKTIAQHEQDMSKTHISITKVIRNTYVIRNTHISKTIAKHQKDIHEHHTCYEQHICHKQHIQKQDNSTTWARHEQDTYEQHICQKQHTWQKQDISNTYTSKTIAQHEQDTSTTYTSITVCHEQHMCHKEHRQKQDIRKTHTRITHVWCLCMSSWCLAIVLLLSCYCLVYVFLTKARYKEDTHTQDNIISKTEEKDRHTQDVSHTQHIQTSSHTAAHAATRCNTCCNTCCNTRCNTLQRKLQQATATHCNAHCIALQHTATATHTAYEYVIRNTYRRRKTIQDIRKTYIILSCVCVSSLCQMSCFCIVLRVCVFYCSKTSERHT